MKRVLVIGCSGAGKSTLAAQIAERTGLPFIPTDPFYWEANWQHASRETIDQRVHETISNPTWVLDGNFVAYRNVVWRRADTIIWLDFPLWLVLFRLVKRNVGWWLTRKPVWSGNRMTVRQAWSGICHALRSHGEKRRTYPDYLAAFPDHTVLRFQTHAASCRWLASLTTGFRGHSQRG
jgi:hypothetical protein